VLPKQNVTAGREMPRRGGTGVPIRVKVTFDEAELARDLLVQNIS
jgi:hypothetical protein